MSQLTFTAVPGFTDIADAAVAAGAVLTDDTMVKINQNAKFAAVRCERIFMGYYKNGDVVPPPVSPVDQNPYTQAEMQYDLEIYCTRAPGPGFVSGQAAAPPISASQPANLYYWIFNIDDSTGKVTCLVSYYKQGGAETVTNDGIVKIYAVCQRQSVNVAN